MQRMFEKQRLTPEEQQQYKAVLAAEYRRQMDWNRHHHERFKVLNEEYQALLTKSTSDLASIPARPGVGPTW
jgi:hypothetical protein